MSETESETFRKSPQNEESEETRSLSDQESETQSLATESEENGVLSEINSEFFQIINSTQQIKQCLDNNHQHLLNLFRYTPKSIQLPFNGVTTDFNDIIDNLHQASLQNIKDNGIINFGELLIAFLENH